MRKGTQNVFNAWSNGRSLRKQVSVWTDGRTIFSYAAKILVRKDDGSFLLNLDKYSRTTSAHQNGIRQMLIQNNIPHTIGII